MTDLTVKGQVTSIFLGYDIAITFIADNDSPGRMVYKATLYGKDVDTLVKKLEDSREITVSARSFEIGSNSHGPYVDLRAGKFVSTAKIEQVIINPTKSDAVEDVSLPQEGE